MKHDANITNARRTVAAIAMASLCMLPLVASAQDPSGAQSSVTGFFTNLNSLLNIASIAVVTIAVIFAGYQIAFNHKRISDVAPVLIGGFLIGAAAQIANMLLPDNVGNIGTNSSTISVMGQLLQYA
ncbi:MULTISPECIES: TrbC/VirB2 family protein [Stenotrophomonas]|jgi:type IV secretion system protein VirB2|uniref:TrbC/VirB2 family protein n=1 Tax=Stenotrophomonas TaxID=40323 RepID=UPI0008B54740|nr:MULTISPECIES: TrbC/VirB2 family protein [Stenotrophomonas]MCO7469997.1 TrbC/VirB2 family protein [Stenotrophomonas maltophilia]MDN8644670.1 TrbC/VirB2 family protein [Stenotrophomonas indicatrix]MDN8655798.1 TrbC/VirB2 family protein [Stenotrophomonas indicatrix]TPD94539.1 TrbC/VirB2 family protein [Stenotrophomonas maltophilia]SET53840.1 type IV secretion system protein VirB2 [Stenotrophomonas indicatrix]